MYIGVFSKETNKIHSAFMYFNSGFEKACFKQATNFINKDLYFAKEISQEEYKKYKKEILGELYHDFY